YLSNLRSMEPVKDVDAPELTFGGVMKGSLTISDPFDELLFESNISISDFMLNNNDYGLVTVKSDWDPGTRVAAINVFNDFEGRKFFDISGTYTPSSKTADITASTDGMPLDILNPFLRAFASDIHGLGSGTVRLQGKLKQFTLTGSVMAQDASMKINFLQTRYSFSDSIRFTPEGIAFRNMRFYDEKRNQGTINGMLSHRAFKEMGINFDINMEKMLVLNTRPKDSDSFYGTAYASGYAGIRGDEKKLTFNISAKTAANTEIFIPLNSSASVSNYPYIIFIDSEKEEEEVKEIGDAFVRQDQGSNIELNFDLEITPEAEVQLIMDATTGGVIRGKGEGTMNISMSSRGDVRMVGDYVIRDGDYLFTLGNILNKRFTVENGGTISWNGPIEDAELNLRALYRTKASLSDIYNKQDFPQLQERIPVEAVLSLSGNLLNPVIKFDILLPTADERTREYLRMAIDTEEKLSRQFLYLLVMNSFYTDPALYSASGSGTGGQVSQITGPGAEVLGVTTTTEMLSNQLSNWLSQISNDFDIGFNYRPGNEITDQEVEVALSTQLLNDKVTLNGNVDVGGNQFNTNASAISGEFTIEVRLTDLLRFKVFNRSNNNLYYQMHPYTQGVGLFYRRDFDTLKDLFINPEERRKRKVAEQTEKEGK
ncbi:MAG: translocation/assembly module TamB domain-containing protein, partial [Bacteroidales bacterium]